MRELELLQFSMNFSIGEEMAFMRDAIDEFRYKYLALIFNVMPEIFLDGLRKKIYHDTSLSGTCISHWCFLRAISEEFVNRKLFWWAQVQHS